VERKDVEKDRDQIITRRSAYQKPSPNPFTGPLKRFSNVFNRNRSRYNQEERGVNSVKVNVEEIEACGSVQYMRRDEEMSVVLYASPAHSPPGFSARFRFMAVGVFHALRSGRSIVSVTMYTTIFLEHRL
jgi:hypothetical protein